MGSTTPLRPSTVRLHWALRFSASVLDIRLHFYPRLQPSAAPQRHVANIRVCLPGRTIRRFAPTPRSCCPPDRGRVLAPAPTPPELCRPSGGVIAGVRSTRDYHPRHLPPLAFLKPSTVCTSSRLACFLSHRHHLWDSKNTNGVSRILEFPTGSSEDDPAREFRDSDMLEFPEEDERICCRRLRF